MKIIYSLLFLLILISNVAGETVIYDTITPSQYKIIQIDDVTNIKYLDEYTYSIYINGSYLGEYKKGDKVEVPDNSNITISVPANIKQELSSNRFVSMLGVGFFAFMQYGVYIVIVILVILYLVRRRR